MFVASFKYNTAFDMKGAVWVLMGYLRFLGKQVVTSTVSACGNYNVAVGKRLLRLQAKYVQEKLSPAGILNPPATAVRTGNTVRDFTTYGAI